jgi:putative pyruvate formate lyase activating enzyme
LPVFVPLDRATLLERASAAREMLRSCSLCERRCGVDRTAGERAPCGLGEETWCFKRHVSFAEELELLPSYMVYLGGCNFRCRFCIQAPDCFDPRRGTRVHPAQDALDFADAVRQGARTINLLGGEPSLHLHTILEIAAAAKTPLPLLLNSNMYMSPEVVQLLDGVVALYVADFKFGNDVCAKELAGVDRYVEVVTRNLRLAASKANVIVRHLLMPGHHDCCFRPVAEWMAEFLPGIRFELMKSYVPGWRAAGRHDGLGRLLTSKERERASGELVQIRVRRCG